MKYCQHCEMYIGVSSVNGNFFNDLHNICGYCLCYKVNIRVLETRKYKCQGTECKNKGKALTYKYIKKCDKCDKYCCLECHEEYHTTGWRTKKIYSYEREIKQFESLIILKKQEIIDLEKNQCKI